MYFRLCFSFSWYDLTLIKKSHTLSFYSVFLLLVTVVAQFTAPFTSEKAMYFLSLISCSINKLKSHIKSHSLTCKSWKWWGGGGGRWPPPAPPPFLYGPERYCNITAQWRGQEDRNYYWLRKKCSNRSSLF